jgi:K+-transporting ATPase KdpF subunit
MNTPLEYILVGIVALGVLIYLIIALLAPEKF